MIQSDIAVATKPVVSAFEALGIAYYIGGSVASSAYGLARATMDIDIIASVKAQHVNPLVQQLQTAYYIDADIMLNAISRQASFNLIHLETMLKVDVFILKNEPYHRITLERRRKDTLDEELNSPKFYFLSAEDVILSKLEWYQMSDRVSKRQWNDVLGVLKVQNQLLDIAYLTHWAAKLQLAELLQQAFGEANL